MKASSRARELTGPAPTRPVLDEPTIGAWPSSQTVQCLAGLRRRVALQIAEALAARAADGAEPLAGIIDALQHQQLLLVVDSCEHVVAHVATVTRQLLRGVPGLTVLATSRTPLQVTGEVLYSVDPLSLPGPDVDEPAALAASGAVELFCQRARDAQAGFGLTADNAAVVAQVCRHLDGLPLAIELAASRLRVLSTHHLLERLCDRFELLSTGDPDGPAHQHTLRGTIDWSHRLLGPAEQDALHALTVFPTGFDLEAADAVMGRTGPTDVIFQLVDKSLVTSRHRAGRVRYELLESIRAFARERAGADELTTARRRHRDHYALLVERERQQRTNWDSVAWCRTVMAEEPNLRQAISCALASQDAGVALQIACGYWVYCLWGGRSEPLDWLSDALATSCDHDIQAHREGLIALAVFTTWWELGSPQSSATWFEMARQWADDSRDDHSRARARYFEA